jgi:TetR/AcrR family transcriptional regulator, repressor for neighboring sulfatase
MALSGVPGVVGGAGGGPPTIEVVTRPRPHGREQVESAIRASARRLVAERGPSGVALREIADDAGVNFGLLYHYFGTKDQLLDDVYAQAVDNAAGRLREVDHLDDALSVLMTLGDGTTARLVTWAVLEGKDPTELFGVSPALSVLAGLVRRDAADAGHPVSADDARVFAAMAMVMALGWRLFGPMALNVAGARSHDPQRYAEQVETYVRRFAHVATAPEGPTAKPKGRAGASRVRAAGRAEPGERPRR